MQNHFYVRLIASIACLPWLQNCASVSSTVEYRELPRGDGVVYYMPKRPFKLTVSIPKDEEKKKGAVSTASVEALPMTPDLEARFILQFEKSLVGKSKLDIVVGTNGLLSSSDAVFTSGVNTIGKNIAQAAGYAVALATAAPVTRDKKIVCKPGQSYQKVFYISNSTETLCDFKFTVLERYDDDNSWKQPLSQMPYNEENYFYKDGTTGLHNKNVAKTSQTHYGLFYKQTRPYLIRATSTEGLSTDFEVSAPDLSPISFIPVSQTFFSSNSIGVKFSDGIVTGVKSETDGEIVAASELPATIIGAYFGAIGQVFQSLATSNEAESTLLKQQQKLEIDATKQKACKIAIDLNSATLKKENLPADAESATKAITTALTNISSACEIK